MKQCTKCGHFNDDSSAFCSNCGTPLAVNTNSQVQQQGHPSFQQQPHNYAPQHSQYNYNHQQPPQPLIVQNKKKHKFLKGVLIAAAIIFFLGIVVPAIFESNNSISDNASSSQSAETTNASGTYNVGSGVIKFNQSEVVKEEYSDDYVLIVNLRYANISDTTIAFDDDITIKAFQSGIELDTPISSYGIPGYDFNNKYKEIKPNVTIDIQLAFYLDDKENSVSLEIFDSPILIDDKPDYTYNINFK